MPNRCQAIAFDQARQDRFEEASQAVQHLNNASQIQTHLIADASQRNAMHVMHERNAGDERSEEHTSELQSRFDLVCRLLLEKKKKNNKSTTLPHTKISKQKSY